MADSAVEITAGSGTNVDTRTESTNGNHRQVVVVGDPSTNAGVAPVDATAGLKVDLGADNDITGTVTANLGATDNAVLDAIEADTTILAGAVSGTEMQVDVVSSALPTGASTAAKQPALGTAGTPSADVLSVQGVASMTALKVDGSAVTQPVSGSVTANAGTNLNTSALALETGGNLASAVTKLNDIDSGKLEEATFTGTLGAVSPTPAVNTVMDRLKTVGDYAATIDADTSTLAGAVSGSEMQVDVVGALPAGSNAIGKLAANSGVDIGDVDVASVVPGSGATNLGKAEDAAHSSGDVGVMALGVRNSALAARSGSDGDYTPLAVDSDGAIINRPSPRGAERRGAASTTGTGDTSLLAASGDAGLRTYIVAMQVMNTGASDAVLTLKDGAAGSTLGYAPAPAGGGSIIVLPVPLRTTANTSFQFASSAASSTIYVAAQGYDAP